MTGHHAFPDDAFRTAKNPTLFDYAKKMGYETIYIDIDNGYLLPLRKAAREGPVEILGPVDDRAVVQGAPHRS